MVLIVLISTTSEKNEPCSKGPMKITLESAKKPVSLHMRIVSNTKDNFTYYVV